MRNIIKSLLMVVAIVVALPAGAAQVKTWNDSTAPIVIKYKACRGDYMCANYSKVSLPVPNGAEIPVSFPEGTVLVQVYEVDNAQGKPIYQQESKECSGALGNNSNITTLQFQVGPDGSALCQAWSGATR
jgi:hypothetical protein